MLKKLIVPCVAVLFAMAASAPSAMSADSPARSDYLISFVYHYKHSEGTKFTDVTTSGNLQAAVDREASFLFGGSVKAEESVTIGLSLKITVRKLPEGKLRVICYLSQNDIDPQDDSGLLVKECGIHCVKTIKPGDTVSLDLGNGRKADLTVGPMPKN